jgi:hypothetical protein
MLVVYLQILKELLEELLHLKALVHVHPNLFSNYSKQKKKTLVAPSTLKSKCSNICHLFSKNAKAFSMFL